VLKRRALLVACALVLPLGLGGCEENYCRLSNEDPVGALFQGLLCLGNKPAGRIDNTDPTASFEVDPLRVENGGTVTLDASGSSDPDGRIVRYRWELDGLPNQVFPFLGGAFFEIDAKQEPVTQQRIFRSVFAPPSRDQGRLIALRVTDDRGASAERQREIVIARESDPTARFTITPNPAFVGQSVFFDGGSSTDAQSWSWDLDGDGTFEVLPAPTATTSRTYTTAGVRRVQLRINFGTSAPADTAAIDLRVLPNATSQSGASAHAAGRARGRRFSARLGRMSLPTDLGRPLRRGATTVVRPLEASGRLIARRRGLGPLRRFRRSRWAARLNLSANGQTGRARLRGLALATFAKRAGRACVRFSMATRAGRSPAGRITVLGGSGPAARLGGRGRFSFRFRDGAPRLAGRLRARAVSHRPLPAACKLLG
jgi:hypothetical protein